MNTLFDLNEKHLKIIKTGHEDCPLCGKNVPSKEMTASVSRGIICQDCDMSFYVK